MRDDPAHTVLYRAPSMPGGYFWLGVPVSVTFGLALAALVVAGDGPWGFALLCVGWTLVIALVNGLFFAYELAVDIDRRELIWRTPLREKRLPLDTVRAVVLGRLGRTIIRTDTRRLRLATPLTGSALNELRAGLAQLEDEAPRVAISETWWTWE